MFFFMALIQNISIEIIEQIHLIFFSIFLIVYFQQEEHLLISLIRYKYDCMQLFVFLAYLIIFNSMLEVMN